MEAYSRVYFLLYLFLAISDRSRTQQKLNPREKIPIYNIDHIVVLYFKRSHTSIIMAILLIDHSRLNNWRYILCVLYETLCPYVTKI